MNDKTLANTNARLIIITGVRTSAEFMPKEISEHPDLDTLYYRYGALSLFATDNSYAVFKNFFDKFKNGNEEIGVIAWGFGGVMIKRYLIENNQPELLKRLKLIVLIGTPSGHSSFLSRFMKFGIGGLRQLNKLYPSAQVYENKWREIVRDHQLNVYVIVGAYDRVVSINSSADYDPNRVLVVDEDYESLKLPKPESMTSRLLYKLVEENL